MSFTLPLLPSLFVELCRFELVLLLPSNQGIRWQYQECRRELMMAITAGNDVHGDLPMTMWPDEESALVRDMATRVRGIEVMVRNKAYRSELESYRKAIAVNDQESIKHIERFVGNKVPGQFGYTAVT